MTSLRLILVSIAFCMVLHTFNILSFAAAVVPGKAAGSLITDASGKIVGSRLIAQAFTSDRYFHPRPSACDYNAQAAAGSNISPTNPDLATRTRPIIAASGATVERPIPADLVTASGSGLDPDITLAAARFQVERIAQARGLPTATLNGLLTEKPIVNVLELNLALDRLTR